MFHGYDFVETFRSVASACFATSSRQVTTKRESLLFLLSAVDHWGAVEWNGPSVLQEFGRRTRLMLGSSDVSRIRNCITHDGCL